MKERELVFLQVRDAVCEGPKGGHKGPEPAHDQRSVSHP